MKRVITFDEPRAGRARSAIAPPALRLEFGNDVPTSTRRRMTYALQVFCAVYNYRFLDARTEEPAVVCKYGEFPPEEAAKSLHIPAKYRASTRGHRTDAAANANYRGEDLLLFHGIEESSGRPDWLGEIFEWLTATYELGCVERDSVDFCSRGWSSAGASSGAIARYRQPYGEL